MLIILEDLGPTGSVTKKYMLSREQIYLDILFKHFPLSIMNNSPTAGSTLGFKHKPEFGLKRLGKLNPMFGKILSPEFILMQNKNKIGKNNPNYGLKKSAETLDKITKLVYVYDSETMLFLGKYPTVECSKTFKLGLGSCRRSLKGTLYLNISN